MNNLPQPLWAVMLAVLGVGLALAVLMHPEPVAISTAVLAIASNLVSGALGAFAGHATANNTVGTINQPTVTVPHEVSSKAGND